MSVMEQQTRSPDPLGDRMKGYERTFRMTLPAKSYSVLRLDGRHFSSWTRGLNRPYDLTMVQAMSDATLALAQDVHGAVLGYTQSDEITIVFTDLRSEHTQPWFGGQVQKIVSIAASLVTGVFGRHFPDRPLAQFDARVFTVPNPIEVANAVYWRQADCERNAVSMIASHFFSAAQLHGKNVAQRRQMLADAGVDLDSFDSRFMHGQLISKQTTSAAVTYTHKRTGENVTLPAVQRSEWRSDVAPELHAREGSVLYDLLRDATGLQAA